MISGKKALIAIANGEDVQIESNKQWVSIKNCQIYQFLYKNYNYKFRIKPRTIAINGIEVPSPFEPKDGDRYWYITDSQNDGYDCSVWMTHNLDDLFIGVWRTEEEIKQVVVALRKVFKGE